MLMLGLWDTPFFQPSVSIWCCMAVYHWRVADWAQVLAEAKAVDDLYAAGKDITPLCGLAFAVKDNIDVVG